MNLRLQFATPDIPRSRPKFQSPTPYPKPVCLFASIELSFGIVLIPNGAWPRSLQFQDHDSEEGLFSAVPTEFKQQRQR